MRVPFLDVCSVILIAGTPTLVRRRPAKAGRNSNTGGNDWHMQIEAGVISSISIYRPPPGLRNPHVQSVLASIPPRSLLVLRASAQLRAISRDVILDCGDGIRLLGQVALAPDGGNGRMAVMIHGWEGSSEPTYILSVAPALLARGYSIFRLNLRDHGNSHHLNQDLFHSCRLDEVVGAFGWIRRHFADKSLSAVGYSLGGNFALRVAAAAPAAQLDLDKVVAICPVLSPAQTISALDSGWWVYRDYFIRRWRTSLERKRAAFPDYYDFGPLSKFGNLTDMTEHFVLRYTGFRDLRSYLNGYALTGERLPNLAVRSTMLLADDDPVIPIQGLADVQVPATLEVCRSAYGGHCGFLDDWGLGSWLDAFVVRQLEAV